MRLDDADPKARVREAEGRLASAKMALNKAELDYARIVELTKTRVETKNAEADARLQLESAHAAMKEIEGTYELAVGNSFRRNLDPSTFLLINSGQSTLFQLVSVPASMLQDDQGRPGNSGGAVGGVSGQSQHPVLSGRPEEMISPVVPLAGCRADRRQILPGG